VCALAGVLVACGGKSPDAPETARAKTVSGETETGMKLKVDTFVAPASDPTLKRIEAWRVEGHYPPVDYHRVTADNSAGAMADSGRTVRFARSANEIAAGKAVEARFSCDALEFEWLPATSAKNDAWNALRKDVCADGPPKPEGIAAGAKQVYFLITDRTFAERGIRSMKVFGPRDAEFK
jgi:hypothetical protein